jgi:ferredoxin-NADP reductase/DMSO/TMAO reductase YedYZ heme-binding membrane subunit
MKIRFSASRVFIWSVLAVPGIVWLLIPAVRGQLGDEPLDESFHRSGEIAAWTLGAVLCLSPLKALFPDSRLVAALNRYRRTVGITGFLYALFHVTLYFSYEGGTADYLARVLEPFFAAGTIAFSILCLLTVTSNNWIIKRLGFSNWKWIHRLVYLAAVVVFYHQAIANRGNWHTAFTLFIPVTTLELLRVGKLIGTAVVVRASARTSAWNGWREFVLDRRVAESETITSFYLRPKDGKRLKRFLPGQYLTIQVTIPNESKTAVRTYTISDAPNPEYYRVSIKREREDGKRPGLVSNWFHDQFELGNVLLAKAPAGDFSLKKLRRNRTKVTRHATDDRPIVLISAGVGVTPMISILNTLVANGNRAPIFFFHGARNGDEHAFGSHVRAIARSHENVSVYVAYSRPALGDLLGLHYDGCGRLGIGIIQQLTGMPYGDFFLCGPGAFMTELYEELAQWGVQPECIHYELFGPATLEFGKPQSPTSYVQYQIRYDPIGESVLWDGRSTLLDIALNQGLKAEYGCRSGVCGTCACRLLKGEVRYTQSPVAPIRKDMVLLCCATPASDIVVALGKEPQQGRSD